MNDIVDVLLRHGVSEAGARELEAFLHEALVPYARPAVVALAGSQSAGLANATSDIDLLVVLSGEAPEPVAMPRVDGIRVDVWPTLKESDVARLERWARETVFTVGTFEISSVEWMSQARLLAELLDGPVLYGADAAAEVRARFDRRAITRSLVVAYAVAQAKAAVDVRGALATRDSATAAESACIAIEHAAQSFLASVGDFYPSRKFLGRRLARVDEALAEDVRAARARCLGEAGTADASEAVRAALSIAVDLQWRTFPLLAEDAPTGDVVRGERDPFHAVVPLDDGHLIFGPTAVRVSARGAATWLAAAAPPGDTTFRELVTAGLLHEGGGT